MKTEDGEELQSTEFCMDKTKVECRHVGHGEKALNFENRKVILEKSSDINGMLKRNSTTTN